MTLDAVIYFLIIALWSAVVSYVVLFRIFRMAGKPHAHAPLHHAPVHHASPAHHVDRPEAHMTAHMPEAPHHPGEPAKGNAKPFSTYEGFRSFAEGEELTVEDIVRGLSRRG